MARSLVIVESPAKAKTLARFLGKNYVIKASRGHVRDLPKSQFGVDLEHNFEPKYITIRGQSKVIKELKQAAGSADRVLLATDPDREGEAISWHLVYLLGLDEDEPCRVVFHEVTPDAVRQALKEPRPVNAQLVNAQQARRVLDRIVGYRLSPLLWKKVRYGLSAGRVQSVAVRLICDRQDEIDRFVPEEYWSLTAALETADGEQFEATYHGPGRKTRLNSSEDADRVRAAVSDSPFTVTRVQRKDRRKNPAPPFTTSTLQQDASRKLGFSARRTMTVAQQLYEGLEVGREGSVGLITYMRTDSPRVSDAGMAQAADLIKERYGSELSQPRRYGSTKARVQDAHEAIRPTGVEREPGAIKQYLSRDQYRMYQLIWSRFIASQMKAAVYDTMSVDITSAGHVFRATGSRVKFPGFLTVYTEGRDNGDDERDRLLPPLVADQVVKLLNLESKRHETQPPPQYSEATLVKAMEELGIGRPSTYAPTLDTIVQRGYVIKESRKFTPTPLGRVVVELLKEHFPDIIDVEFTAAMEEKLDRVEEGDDDWRRLIGEFFEPFEQSLARAEENVERQKIPDEPTDEVCEQCGRNMVIKHGRYGRFLACPGYPECKNTRALVTRTGVPCPHCGSDLVGRKSRKGRVFYGCSSYPDCKFVSWHKPVPGACPDCGSMMIERRKRGQGMVWACSSKECHHERTPDREADSSD